MRGKSRGDKGVEVLHHASRSRPLHTLAAAPALRSLPGWFLLSRNNAGLFGLQTPQGEFCKSFLLLLCEKKKKNAAQ